MKRTSERVRNVVAPGAPADLVIVEDRGGDERCGLVGIARSEIRGSHPEHRPEGDGMAVAGLVLGYVQLLLSVLFVFVVIAVLFFGFALGGWHGW